MQRRLILMRHAKSAWDSAVPTDHARPLNARGRHEAPLMGAWLVERGWVPDAVFSSDATRTHETWEHMADAFSPRPPVVFTDRLYHAGLGALRDLAQGWSPRWKTILALGHNPGFEEAASWLCGEALHLSTANCALLCGTGPDWAQALEQSWQLVDHLRPRDLESA